MTNVIKGETVMGWKTVDNPVNPKTEDEKRSALKDFEKGLAVADHRMAESQAIEEGARKALERLASVAYDDTGQSHTCRRFLLGLYNGQEWPTNLSLLRGLDPDLQDAYLLALRYSTLSSQDADEFAPAESKSCFQDFAAMEKGRFME